MTQPPTEIGVTAFDEWNCRVDVIRVGADLRVRPQNKLRSGEDGRTHRSAPTVEASAPTVEASAPTVEASAPTVEASTPTSGSPDEQSTELPKREKTSLFTCM